MINPQIYVEFGAQLAVMEERISQVTEIKNFELTFGGEKFGLKTSLNPGRVGCIVFKRQKSNLSISRSCEHDIMHKPVLGIYVKHTKLDILEICALKKAAE